MLDFQNVQLSDKNEIDKLLALSDYNGCTYSFGSLYCWGGYYNTRFAIDGSCLYIIGGEGEKQSYMYPAGTFDLKTAINTLLEDAKERGINFALSAVTSEQKLLLEEAFPNKFEFTADRDFFDYIYNKSDLQELAGKKYHGKRNHISKFMRSYNWSYEEVTQSNLDKCRKVAQQWCIENDCKDSGALKVERCALARALDSFSELGFSGGLLSVEDEPVAFCLGEGLNSNTYITHYEKALRSFNGAYTMINREFAKNTVGAQYEHINREEDTGDEGLRKAKLSYYPAVLLEKYYVTLRG